MVQSNGGRSEPAPPLGCGRDELYGEASAGCAGASAGVSAGCCSALRASVAEFSWMRTTIGTGAWCGHHDVVNPTYYLREKRETVSPQGQQVRTEGFANGGVESLAEAFHRVRPGCMTAAIHAPFGRSARHAVLEGRNLGDRGRLKALTLDLAGDQNPRWKADGFEGVINESVLDTRGLAQVIDVDVHEVVVDRGGDGHLLPVDLHPLVGSLVEVVNVGLLPVPLDEGVQFSDEALHQRGP